MNDVQVNGHDMRGSNTVVFLQDGSGGSANCEITASGSVVDISIQR